MGILEAIFCFLGWESAEKSEAWQEGWKHGARNLGHQNAHKPGSAEHVDYEEGFKVGAKDRDEWPG